MTANPSHLPKTAITLLTVLALAIGVVSAARMAPAAADPGAPRAYARSVFNLSPDATVGSRALYAATPEQRIALATLETSATDSVIAEHGLTASDPLNMLGWARDDIRAQIYDDLIAIIDLPAGQRTSDEQLDYQWVQAVVQRQAIQAALDAVGEYNLWSGDPSYTQQGVANPNPPLNYSADGSSGYCVYEPPDADAGDDSYHGTSDSTCFIPCQNPAGCAAPTPSYDTFLGWGNYDEDKTLIAAPGVPTAVPTTADAVAGTIASIALGVGGAGAAGAIPVGGALAGTALQEAILPYAARSFAGAGEALGAVFAFIVAVVVIAAVVATLRGIAVVDEDKLPDQLDALVAGARADVDPPLPSIMAVPYGAQMLMAFVVGATTPDPDLSLCDPNFNDCTPPQPLPSSDSDQIVEVKAYGQPFGTLGTTFDSRDWSGNAQTTRISGGWFVTAGTDPVSGAASTVQALSWRYLDANGKRWTARLVQGTDGRRHFVSTMLAADWAAGSDAQPCTDVGTCSTGDSITDVGAAGGLETVRLLGVPPTAYDDNYRVDPQAGTLAVPAPGVLANDTDPQGQALIAFIDTEPEHGSLHLLADGSFSYQPDSGYAGQDSFTYTVANTDRERSAAATVYLTDVGPPPVASGDFYTTPTDTTLVVTAPGVQANDQAPLGLEMYPIEVTLPGHGTLVGRSCDDRGICIAGMHPDGSFSYTPDAGFVGTDSFTYDEVSDTGQTSAPVTITIQVGPIPQLPPPPHLTIAAPASGEVVELGAIVDAYYSCASQVTILFCLGSTPSGAPMDTFTPGPKRFTVTALDNNFQSASASVDYTVRDTTAPTVTIASPADGATFVAGQSVQASYTCSDLALSNCQGSVPQLGAVDTATIGVKTLTVTGTDSSGNETTVTAHYTVVAGAPAHIRPVSGSTQVMVAGSMFTHPLTARVLDARGFRVPHAPVIFRVESGSARFPDGASEAIVRATALGNATSPTLIAGADAGPVLVTATSPPIAGADAAVYLDTVTAAGPGAANLSVHVKRTPRSTPVGGSFTATVTVTNTGSVASDQYDVALLLWHCLAARGTDGDTTHRSAVVFTGADLAPGESISHTVVLDVNSTANTRVVLRAVAFAAQPEVDYADNVATRIITIG